MFISKKREAINTFVCAVSLYVAETPKASIEDQKAQLPVIPFDIVAYYNKVLFRMQMNRCNKMKGATTND